MRPLFRRSMTSRALPLAAAILILAAIAAFGCQGGAGPATAPRPQADSVTLLFTGHTNGNLEPCNCPGQSRGGLSRRKTLLDTLRSGGPTVLLDNGNSVLLTPEPLADRAIWTGMGWLGYDAVAVGDQELDRGAAEFAKAARAAGLPLVGTNVRLADPSSGSLGAPSRRIVCGRRSVLVVSILGAGMMKFAAPAVRQAIELAEPVAAVERALAATQPADVVVALAVLEPMEREPIVSRLRGVDLVVLSTEQDTPVEVARMGRTPVVFAPAMGRQIGRVTFVPGGGVAGRPMRIAFAAAAPVEKSLPRDRALWELYQSYTYDAQQQTLRLLGRAGDLAYRPSADCGACHPAQYAAWRKTPHGRAWATIEREGRPADPACARCHTVGFGYAGGFRTARESPGLADVGCQSCHHVDLRAMPPRVRRPIGTLTCKGCHTEPKSPEFDIAVYGPKVTCPAGRATSRPDGAVRPAR